MDFEVRVGKVPPNFQVRSQLEIPTNEHADLMSLGAPEFPSRFYKLSHFFCLFVFLFSKSEVRNPNFSQTQHKPQSGCEIAICSFA